MAFSDTPAARRIRDAANRGTLSHALLFSGGGDLAAAARYAAAAMECQGGDKPCGVCPACRKVFSDIHPDVITVRDEQHKNLSVDTVRQIRADAYIRPNEGARKVYIFPDCAILTEQDQNVLLKIVEEGPPYAAFLFCAENTSAVLQTLRSRCVELKLHPAESGGTESAEAGAELCRLLTEGKRGRRHGTDGASGTEADGSGRAGCPAGSGPGHSHRRPAVPVRRNRRRGRRRLWCLNWGSA